MRQIVHTSIGGTAARVRISNQYGTSPLTIADVRVAVAAGGGRITAGTDHALTFGGAATATVQPGRSLLSDPVSLAVPARGDLAVSLYLPDAAAHATEHSVATRTNYVAAGDQSGAASMRAAQTRNSYYFLAGVDVMNSRATGAVVTFGASITDGTASTYDADRRWPDLLSQRLAASGRTVGVLNAGISGNQLLQDGQGESALKRFDRDVLQQTGVRWVIFSDDPINDLSGPNAPPASELINAMSQLIARAHAAGIKFYCSTLTPFQGSSGWSPKGEQGRDAVNAFIRSAASGCDGVIDQDTATHDPAAPTRYRPAVDSGDHLHPNDRGMQDIADAVPLNLFG
ncbi:SGNH/GDSL hydrolase family protein [Actinoplanes sp. TBRC 11911]|nr:SGNH/GDSL hydrolase family protein [Actinoplanes sp. TBRC 11911]